MKWPFPWAAAEPKQAENPQWASIPGVHWERKAPLQTGGSHDWIGSTELAIESALDRGCRYVTLLGAAGGRLDHILGNVSLVAKYPGRVAMVDRFATLVAVNSTEKCRIEGKRGSLVSLIPFPVAEKVTTLGLQYPMEQEDLFPGTRGISNTLCQRNGCVCVQGGLLLVFIEHGGLAGGCVES